MTLVKLTLALDAGTTGVRAIAFDEAVQVQFESYRELTQHFPAPGEVEHDALEIAHLAVEVLGEVARWARAEGHAVEALGITNQRETVVCFDRASGRVAGRALVWQDRRGANFCDELRLAGHEDRVREVTGLVLDAYFSGSKMHWLLNHGAADAFTSPALATIETWLIWWLTGGVEDGEFATEASNASRTLLFDLDALTWSKEMGELFGVDAALLAEVRPSAGSFGEVSARVLPELGGLPISGALGDQQAALFGQACFAPGVVKATYGTGAFVLANTGARPSVALTGLLTTIAWDLGPLGSVTYALEGSAFVAGAAVQWLRDELSFIAHSSELEALALSVPDSAGVNFVPAFTGLGSPFWHPEARGAITGLTRGAGRAHVARALVEALAYQVRAITDAFRDGGVVLRELRADGGAAAMNHVLQLQASASRLPVLRSASLEATARGAATLAGLSTGLYPSLDALEGLWHCDRRFEPEDPLFADAGYDAWRRACLVA
ncbi:MAG: glycerol kinase GlpK [Acidobacteriota bacterium]|nr:glycerol kinase GlpK [Acidobacteriota bacterium]